MDWSYGQAEGRWKTCLLEGYLYGALPCGNHYGKLRGSLKSDMLMPIRTRQQDPQFCKKRRVESRYLEFSQTLSYVSFPPGDVSLYIFLVVNCMYKYNTYFQSFWKSFEPGSGSRDPLNLILVSEVRAPHGQQCAL